MLREKENGEMRGIRGEAVSAALISGLPVLILGGTPAAEAGLYPRRSRAIF